MGGDGGVVATDRRYMRGAGTADHTGDYNNNSSSREAAGSVQQQYDAREAMTTCALTKTPLTGTSSVVADPYGRLYHREAAVQALLRRKQQQQQQQQEEGGSAVTGEMTGPPLGPHVRRLADLYEVRFHRDGPSSSSFTAAPPCCPITGKALTGGIPAILLVPGRGGAPNVVSGGALKQLSPAELEEEYGPIHRQIRLAPPPAVLKDIQEQVRLEQEKEEDERNAKRAAKAGKRKRRLGAGGGPVGGGRVGGEKKRAIVRANASVGQHVQSRVDSAIQMNPVLSSLFVNKATSRAISEKEHKDNLFAR